MATITKMIYSADGSRCWLCTTDNEGVVTTVELSKEQAQSQKICVGDSFDVTQATPSPHPEKNRWKNAYQTIWPAEKVRLERVATLISELVPTASIHVTGFGADSTEYIDAHPAEQGVPDLKVVSADGLAEIEVEVTGTHFMRGSGYWVRPDKLTYAKNHPELDVWLILHYAEPTERLIFIRPGDGPHKIIHPNIRGNSETYVEYTDASSEVVSPERFAEHLRERLTP